MATPENRLAGLEERIKKRRERNVRLAQRVEQRTQNRALEAAGIRVPRLEMDPATGGIRRADLAPRSVVERETLPVVARERARQQIIRGQDPRFVTPEEQKQAVERLTPRTGDMSQNVTEADRILAEARPVERFIARQQAFTPLGGLSKAVENIGGMASYVFDPADFTGVRQSIRRRRELEKATEELPENRDLTHRLTAVGSDFFQVAGELAGAKRIPRIGPALAGEIEGVGSTVARRVASRAALEAASGAALEQGVGLVESGDPGEAARRGRFGAAAGAVLGGAFQGLGERLAARRASRLAAQAVESEERRTAQEALERAQEDIRASLGERVPPSRRLPPGRAETPPGAIPMGGRTAAEEAAQSARLGREAEGITRETFAVPPERQLPPGREGTGTGSFRLGGEQAPLRTRLKADYLRARAAQTEVEGLTRQAREALVKDEPTPPPVRKVSAPPPSDEASRLIESLQRRIEDGQRELEQAYTDPLTGLKNQTAWRRAQPRIEQAADQDVLLIDLRNFKGVNDLVSMQAGDTKLKQVAEAIRRAVGDEIPDRDIFRAGGDEFVVAIPKGTGDRIGPKIVQEIGESPIADSGLNFGSRYGSGPTFAAADRAASAAKKAETGARFRNVLEHQDVTPTVSQARSIDENVTRRSILRRFRRGNVARAEVPTGRPALKPPESATKGPNGAVDHAVDPKTGKVVIDERTAQARQKSAFVDSSEGGFLVDPRRDALEATPPANLKPYEKRVQDQISVGERSSWRERLPSMLDLYTMLVRRTAGIEKANELLGGAGKGSIDDAAVAAHLASGSERRAESFLEYGPMRWTHGGEVQQTGTPGFTEILAPFQGRLNELRRFLLAARTVEVGKRDIKTGVSLDDAQRIFSEAPEDIRNAQRQIVQYLRDVARYYADATGMPDEQLQQMFALGEDYIPLTRVFEGRDVVSQGAGTVGRAGQALRKLRGSERKIQDPIESIVDYTKRMIRAADTNRIAKNLIDAAEAAPERSVGLVAKIERPPVPALSQAAERLQKAAQARGKALTDDEAMSLAEALGADQLNIADDVVRVWRGGELQAYRVAPSIARGIKAMQPRDMDLFLKLAGLIPRGLKAGVTLNPGFQVFNIIRDTFDATVQSEYGFRPWIEPFVGFYQSAKATWLGKPSDVYREFAQAGGGFASFRGSGRRGTQEQLRRVLPRIQSRTGRIIDVATLPIRHPVQLLKEFAAPFEEAARLGEYMRARSKDAHAVDAVLASKKVTVDFQQIGAAMQGVSYATAFLNAGIQSVDTMLRVLARPVTKGAEEGAAAGVLEAARVFGAAVGAISIPSMYFWVAGHGDAEIEDLRRSQAGLIYWFARTPKGEIIRLPKPFMWGQIFGTGMEAALDKVYDQDPEAMSRWVHGMRNAAAINVLPNALQIPAEQFANKSLAFGTPIVPQELERVEPRMQATERTSRLARKIGELANVSPARIDKVMRDVGGTLPADILRLIDQSVDRFDGDAITEPAATASDIAFFGRFVQRSPTLSVQSVQTFWDNAIAAEEALNSFNLLKEQGNAPAMQALFNRRFEDFVVAQTYEGSRRAISEIRNAIDAVQTLPDDFFPEGVDPAKRKRELIDQYLQQYIDIARLTNQAASAALQNSERPNE